MTTTKFTPTEFIDHYGEKIPVVPLKVLVRDRCNIMDEKFEREVDHFMRDFMPSFPLGLLDTDDPDKWEIEASYSVVQVDVEPITAPDGSSVHAVVDETLSKEIIAAVLKAAEDCKLDAGVGETWWVVVNESGALVDDRVFDFEDDADEYRRDREDESRYGFPWAWGTAWMPRGVTDSELQAAGFVVANYLGGDGSGYRLAGIDGGGYSFMGAHFAPLCAIWHWNRRPGHGYVGPIETTYYGRCFIQP